jgi:hypothetical protein
MTESSTTAKRQRTLFFFGAGASAAESPFAPTNYELYDRIRRSLVERRRLHPTLHRFLDRWEKDDYAHMPTVEELLSILDTCLQRGEPIGQGWSITELTRCREELLGFIHEFIGLTCEERGAEAHDKSLYQRLLTCLSREHLTLISLNYDTLLDGAIRRVGLRADYGLDFLVAPDVPPDTPKIKLFKLHGSLNWAYCPSCLTTLYTEVRRITSRWHCPNCGRQLEALIVPPSPLKVPPSPFLSALWKKAEWELAQTCEIVFIGYSLSDADANIRYLLFRGFFDEVPRVTVVLDMESPAVMDRYRRLFPGGVSFYLGGFEEYLRRCERQARAEA